MTHGKQVMEQISGEAAVLRAHIPDVYEGFAHMQRTAMAPGALDTKTKELIAFAIGVTEQCDGCIASHARGAARAGASKEEAAEAIGVAILMSGGPGTIYGPRAFSAFAEYHEHYANT